MFEPRSRGAHATPVATCHATVPDPMHSLDPHSYELSPDRARALLSMGTPCARCRSSRASIASRFISEPGALVLEHSVVCSQCDNVTYVERERRPSAPPPPRRMPTAHARPDVETTAHPTR